MNEAPSPHELTALLRSQIGTMKLMRLRSKMNKKAPVSLLITTIIQKQSRRWGKSPSRAAGRVTANTWEPHRCHSSNRSRCLSPLLWKVNLWVVESYPQIEAYKTEGIISNEVMKPTWIDTWSIFIQGEWPIRALSWSQSSHQAELLRKHSWTQW